MASNIVPFPRRGANDNHNPTPPQPGLRSFIVYDELPENCIAFEVDDDQTAPHVWEGEFVVVDPDDCEPAPGELFVCAFHTAYPDKKRLRVMEVSNASFMPGHFLLSEVQPQWLIPLSGALPTRKIKFMDGPYPPDHLRDYLFRGKVVGIYRPDFRKLMTEAA